MIYTVQYDSYRNTFDVWTMPFIDDAPYDVFIKNQYYYCYTEDVNEGVTRIKEIVVKNLQNTIQKLQEIDIGEY